LYGFEAITAHNGWAMAFAGALIVFAGLVVLSTAIAQIHKILMLFDKKKPSFVENTVPPVNDVAEFNSDLSIPQHFPVDIKEAANLYQPLIEEIGETFFLSDLYEISRKNNFPHPHITFTAFRESGILLPQGEGVFTWHQPEDNDDNSTG